MSREQPVEPAPDIERIHFDAWFGEPACWGVMAQVEDSVIEACWQAWQAAIATREAIEALVPRPEPSMSMFANKQDYETARAGTGVQPPAGEDVYHLRAYGDVSKEQLDYYSVHGTLDGFGETQRSPQPSRPDEKEGGPAIEDRARLLDALETIDIIWRHYVKPHTSDWRETEKAIKTVRAALGVEPRPQDRQEGTAVSSSSEPSASGGAVQRAAGEG